MGPMKSSSKLALSSSVGCGSVALMSLTVRDRPGVWASCSTLAWMLASATPVALLLLLPHKLLQQHPLLKPRPSDLDQRFLNDQPQRLLSLPQRRQLKRHQRIHATHKPLRRPLLQQRLLPPRQRLLKQLHSDLGQHCQSDHPPRRLPQRQKRQSQQKLLPVANADGTKTARPKPQVIGAQLNATELAVNSCTPCAATKKMRTSAPPTCIATALLSLKLSFLKFLRRQLKASAEDGSTQIILPLTNGAIIPASSLTALCTFSCVVMKRMSVSATPRVIVIVRDIPNQLRYTRLGISNVRVW